jgi:hypothetical protein
MALFAPSGLGFPDAQAHPGYEGVEESVVTG